MRRFQPPTKVDGFRLGQWVGVQRKNKDQLSPERLAKLESRGFVWDVLGAAWDQGFAHLQQYVAEHGHTRVPATHKVDGFRLGQWVSTQRKNTDQLSAERVWRGWRALGLFGAPPVQHGTRALLIWSSMLPSMAIRGFFDAR